MWGYFPTKGFKGFLLKILGHPHPNGRMRAHLVKKFLKNPAKNLDIGCGEGIFYKEMTNLGYDSYGLDFSEDALNHMRQKLKTVGINAKIMQADAQRLPILSNSFESAICLDVIEHVENSQDALIEIGRVLKKNGLLILSVPNSLYLTKPILPIDFSHQIKAIGHENPGYNLEQLKPMLKKAGFKIEEHYYYLKFFGRIVTEISFALIGKNMGEARKKMYTYSYLSFFAFALTYPIMMIDRILPNSKGGMLVLKARKI